MNKNTVLITGAAGFFGGHLSRLYLRNGYQVIGYDIVPAQYRHANLKFINGDMSETDKILNILNEYKPAYLIHLAGLLRANSRQLLFDVNVHGTYSICEAVKNSELNLSLGLVSSSAVYSPCNEQLSELHELCPITEYGLTKKIQEEIVINYSKRGFFSCKIYRPFNLIGNGMPKTLAVSSFLERLKASKRQGVHTIEVGNLASTRDYIDIRDAADIVFQIQNMNSNETEVINICSGIGYKMADILELCFEVLEFRPQININHDLIQRNDITYQVGCAEKLWRYLGAKATYNLEDSLIYMLKNLDNRTNRSSKCIV